VNGKRGFTLIEVVVAMTIMVIAIGLVGPRIGAGLGRLEMNSATQTVRGVIRIARLQAQRAERTQYVVFDKNRRAVSLVNDAMNVVREKELPSSVDIVLEGDVSTSALYVLPSGIVRGNPVRLRGHSTATEVMLP